MYQTGTLQEPPGKLTKLPMFQEIDFGGISEKGVPDNLVNSHTPVATMRPIMSTEGPKLRFAGIVGSVSIRHNRLKFFESLLECFQEPSVARMIYQTIRKMFHGDLANHDPSGDSRNWCCIQYAWLSEVICGVIR